MTAQSRSILIVAALLLSAAVAHARAPDDIDSDAKRLLVSVGALEPSDLAAGFRGGGDVDFVGQLTDGELNHTLGYYDDAALILAELVEHPDAYNEAGYPRALWLLGDSLYEIENFGLAQSYYRRLFDLRDRDYSLEAGLRLVEIELKKRDYEAAIARLEEVEARYGDVAGDALIYVRGKVRYESGEYATAVSVFDRLGPDSEYYAKAQYLAGVAETQLEKYDEALTRFQALDAALEQAPALSEEDAIVQQLTELAQARLYYEAENWAEAVYHYAQVDPESEQFDNALYEMSWTMINEERYMDAAYNLEVLAQISNDTRFVAEARLLAGNMKRRAGQYQEAESLFDSTGDDYLGIYRQLDAIVTSDLGVADMYRRVDTIDTGGVDAPLEVADWVSEDPLVARALLYVKSAAEIQSWLEEGRGVVAELNRILGEGNLYNIFPAASRFRGTMSTYWKQSVFLRAEAVDEQYRAVKGQLTPAQSSDYQTLHREREALLQEFKDTDFRVTIDESAADSNTASMDAMIGDLGAAETELESAVDEISELQVLLRQRIARGDMTPQEAMQVEADLSDTREELIGRLDQVRTQRRDLLAERAQRTGGRGALEDAEDEAGMRLLRELVATLRTESQLLTGAASADSANAFVDIYRTLDTVDSRLNALRGDLANALAQRRDAYARMLSLERRRLAGMQQTLDSQSEKGSELTSDIAKESLLLTHQRVADVVLRANLGSIDVSWWQKESISKKIDELFDEKSRQLQILDADFAEILGGQ